MFDDATVICSCAADNPLNAINRAISSDIDGSSLCALNSFRVERTGRKFGLLPSPLRGGGALQLALQSRLIPPGGSQRSHARTSVPQDTLRAALRRPPAP